VSQITDTTAQHPVLTCGPMNPYAPPQSLEACVALDEADPLRPLRDAFSLPPATIYLDGNSLGAMPREAAQRVAHAVSHEWGHDLIQSWNRAGWFDLPQRVGDGIARLIGANPGEVVATDSTSTNLFKVLSAALRIVHADGEGTSSPRVVLSERSNFPTDLYIAEGLCNAHGLTLKLVEDDASGAAVHAGIEAAGDALALVMLTHVNYRTGAMHDMAAVTAAAHAAGALTVWDLAHSAGAVPVDLNAAGADFAVGCGYKYLNGGPGAPAFVWVNARHVDRFWQPLSGWWGHAAPFSFVPGYQPAKGVNRYLCGTQPILSLTALETGVQTVLAAESMGGMAALRAKSLALTEAFIAWVDERCGGHGLQVISPRNAARRGSQVGLARFDASGSGVGTGGYAIVQALIARGVVGDFRAGDAQHPDILRFGFAPLYIRFQDVWQAVEHLREVMEKGEWQLPRFQQHQAVT
jgi:kynureninase